MQYTESGMKWFKTGKQIGVCLLLAVSALSGCVSQEANLSYSPVTVESQIETTPEITQKPEATPFSIYPEAAGGETIPTDTMGIAVIDPDTHYFRFYVSFSEIRIYEEDEQDYLDGICTNGFEQDLHGRCRIVFYDTEGQKCGEGVLHTSDSLTDMDLLCGDNRIFSEIASETDVSGLAFEIETIVPFLPVEQ